MRTDPSDARRSRASGHVRLVDRTRGGPAWYVKYRTPDGRQVQRLLGSAWLERGRPPVGYLTERTANDKLGEILADARRGTREGQQRGTETFADACAEWLRYVEHDRGRRASTVADYRGVVEHRLLPAIGAATPLAAITTRTVDDYRDALLAEGRVSPRTIQKLMVCLHGILKRAKRKKWIDENPAADAERQTVKRSGHIDVFSPAEVEALARAAETPQDAALFVAAAFTGMRQGELLALRWRDVDFPNALVRVERSYTHGAEGATKSGLVRSVPLIDRAARALDDLSRRERFTERDDLVFPSVTGGHQNDGVVRRKYYAALDRAGLRRLRFHDLRHVFGTLAVQAFPLSDVKAYMGHADIATTMIYVHHVPQRDAADRLGRVVAASGGVAADGVSLSALQERH